MPYPGSTAMIVRKLLTSSPLPTRSAKAIATWPTTNMARGRLRADPGLPSARELRRLARASDHAGTKPKARLLTKVTATPNRKTPASRRGEGRVCLAAELGWVLGTISATGSSVRPAKRHENRCLRRNFERLRSRRRAGAVANLA